MVTTPALAGFWHRFGSGLIDGVIIYAAFTIIDLIDLVVLWATLGPGSSLIDLLIGLGYYTWGFGSGQTVGCRLTKLRIIDVNSGAPPGYATGLVHLQTGS